MKKGIRILALSAIVILLLLMAVYFVLAFYYREGFSLNTWINGVYCTGKTVEEVNAELLEGRELSEITIVDREGRSYTLSLSELDYARDYQETLEQYLEEQNPLYWLENFTADKNHILSAAISFDEQKLEQQWGKLEFVQEERQKDRTLEIQLTAEGYRLMDGLSDRLNEEKAWKAVRTALEMGQEQVDLTEAGAYEDCEPNAEQRKILELWKQVEEFQKCRIVYDMGAEKIPLDEAVMSRFLALEEDGSFAADEKGNLFADEEKIEDFINGLAEEYNTYGREREFTATRGDVVTIKGGTYGTELDVRAEYAYLKEAVADGRSETHIPAYKREAFCRGADDIGDTYVEVDMTEQKMYYYQDGELMLETDIVTGNTGRRMGTPEGVNFVYGKQKNRVLRGPGYASPVKFWMPVKGGIGIHDASWRDEFGGEIYKRSGSHGCINTPTDKMAELYDMVEIGTPVVMFY